MPPNELPPAVYDELRRLAASKLRNESDHLTLNATALVNEAWLKLGGDTASRSEFFRKAALVMRHILVDHARAKKAQKRGGGKRVDYDLERHPDAIPSSDLEILDEALTRLNAVQPEVAELVHLRYFVGLSIPEAATILGISPRTADAWWAYARGWLATELKKP